MMIWESGCQNKEGGTYAHPAYRPGVWTNSLLVYSFTGVVYHLRKDYVKAEEAYSLALKLQPDLALARENFNKLLSVRNKITKSSDI
jgi:tetratricopeptide (TPR) repeat protein